MGLKGLTSILDNLDSILFSDTAFRVSSSKSATFLVLWISLLPHQTQQNRECHWPPENIVHHPADIKRAQSFQKVDIPLALTVGGLLYFY